MINKICACLGPMYNEPYCPCKMVDQNLERSDEYKEYMLPENVEKRNAELKIKLENLMEIMQNSRKNEKNENAKLATSLEI